MLDNITLEIPEDSKALLYKDLDSPQSIARLMVSSYHDADSLKFQIREISILNTPNREQFQSFLETEHSLQLQISETAELKLKYTVPPSNEFSAWHDIFIEKIILLIEEKSPSIEYAVELLSSELYALGCIKWEMEFIRTLPNDLGQFKIHATSN